MTRRFTLPFLFALIGVIDSIVLLYLHYRYVSVMGYSSFCTVNDFVNCDLIQTSSYAYLGGISVSLLAFIYYSFLVGLTWPKWHTDEIYFRRHSLIFLLSSLAFIYSLFLAGISLFHIGALCIPCVILYCVNLGLFTWAFLHPTTKTFGGHIREVFCAISTTIKKQPVTVVLTVVLLGGLLLTYRFSMQKIAERSVAGLPKEVLDLPFDINRDPVRGRPTAPLTIIEFSDFQCGFCRQSAEILEELLRIYPAQIKIVYKHFPLDRDCNPRILGGTHPMACLAAKASECAQKKGQFWEMHDLIFQAQKQLSPVTIEQMALKLGWNLDEFRSCLQAVDTTEGIQLDLQDSLRIGVNTTPTFYFNKQIIRGHISLQAWKKLIQSALH